MGAVQSASEEMIVRQPDADSLAAATSWLLCASRNADAPLAKAVDVAVAEVVHDAAALRRGTRHPPPWPAR